ncbi:lysM domain-containing GPI-anchored protein 1-like, partial [Trifolium medium]|nr:lysM domain-containing GPI-anchored protein 1-like [Trifolium medium]
MLNIYFLNDAAGQQEFPPLIAPPTSVERDSVFAPAPSPSSLFDGTDGRSPKSSVGPSTGFTPANGPISGISSGASAACSLVKPLPTLTLPLVLLLVKLMIPAALLLFLGALLNYFVHLGSVIL